MGASCSLSSGRPPCERLAFLAWCLAFFFMLRGPGIVRSLSAKNGGRREVEHGRAYGDDPDSEGSSPGADPDASSRSRRVTRQSPKSHVSVTPMCVSRLADSQAGQLTDGLSTTHTSCINILVISQNHFINSLLDIHSNTHIIATKSECNSIHPPALTSACTYTIVRSESTTANAPHPQPDSPQRKHK